MLKTNFNFVISLIYKDISTASHVEEYGQLSSESNDAGQQTTTVYEDEIAYKRLIRRKRNSSIQILHSERLGVY